MFEEYLAAVLASTLFAGMGWLILFWAAAGVIAMYVLYMLADDIREFEILTRCRPSMLSVLYSNESVWMVPGTLSADE